jgi:hypothetical protein
MLGIKSDAPSHPKTTAHLLPCRVHYDGPVEPAQSYWSPTQKDGKLIGNPSWEQKLNYSIIDGTRVAYFRGRKLLGKTVKLPEGYRGVVVETETPPPATAEPEQDVVDLGKDEVEERVALASLETKAEFEEFVVWGHEAMADATSDPYVRIEDWTRLAEQVRLFFCTLDQANLC